MENNVKRLNDVRYLANFSKLTSEQQRIGVDLVGNDLKKYIGIVVTYLLNFQSYPLQIIAFKIHENECDKASIQVYLNLSNQKLKF